MALNSDSDEIWPCLPISLTPATVVPRPSAIVRIRNAAFSPIERNSSPAKLPEDNAWPNCITAAVADSTLDPDSATARLTVCVTLATSFCERANPVVADAIFEYRSAVADSDVNVLRDITFVSFKATLNSSTPVVASFSLLFI